MFSKITIASKDSLSLQLNALKIYQKLIQFHQKNKHIAALIDIDIHRLNFVKQHATFQNKETIYLNSLKHSKEMHPTEEASGLYAFEIAEFYEEKASQYKTSKLEKKSF